MELQAHDLSHDSAAQRETSHALKRRGDAHFARLFDACPRLNEAIRRLEEAGFPLAGEPLEDRKEGRRRRKDALCAMLRAGAA